MRDGLIEELKAAAYELECREAEIAMREQAVETDIIRLRKFEDDLNKRAAALDACEKEAQNLLKSTLSIRQELANRKARIVTLEHEAATREEKLSKARNEKGELQSQVTALKKLITV